MKSSPREVRTIYVQVPMTLNLSVSSTHAITRERLHAESTQSNTDLLLPDFESVDVDIVLYVLKGPAEATHLAGKNGQFGLQLTHLAERRES